MTNERRQGTRHARGVKTIPSPSEAANPGDDASTLARRQTFLALQSAAVWFVAAGQLPERARPGLLMILGILAVALSDLARRNIDTLALELTYWAEEADAGTYDRAPLADLATEARRVAQALRAAPAADGRRPAGPPANDTAGAPR